LENNDILGVVEGRRAERGGRRGGRGWGIAGGSKGGEGWTVLMPRGEVDLPGEKWWGGGGGRMEGGRKRGRTEDEVIACVWMRRDDDIKTFDGTCTHVVCCLGMLKSYKERPMEDTDTPTHIPARGLGRWQGPGRRFPHPAAAASADVPVPWRDDGIWLR